MTASGFTATGGAIGLNPSNNDGALRAMYHDLATDALKVSSGSLYVRMLLNLDSTAAAKLSAGETLTNKSGGYFGLGIGKFYDLGSGNNSRYYILRNASNTAALSFVVWKNGSNQYVLSLALTDAYGALTSYPLVTGITLGETYLCYAEIKINAGTDDQEIVRAGAVDASSFVGAVLWADIGGETDSVEVQLMSNAAYPTAMGVAGPYGTNGGRFLADELVVGTALSDIVPVGGVFAVTATGTPTVGTDSFSTGWILVADEGVTADAGIVYSTDETFATATTNALGSALAAGTRTATATGLEPDTTYWWKICADNGTEVAETEPASFTTRGAPILGAASATLAGNAATFSAALAEAAMIDTLATSVSVFYGTDGENWTELPLGTASAPQTFSGTATGLDYGVACRWFVRASATLPGGRVLSADSATATFTPKYVGDMYVSAASASPASPYATPETAATKIQDALACATDGTTIHVAPGLYTVSTPLSLSAAIRVLGDDPDPSRTIVSNTVKANYQSGNRRVFILNHANAFVANLTMQKGSAWGDWVGGGNLFIDSQGGTVSNCVLEAGIRVNGHDGGGGAALSGGLLTHSVIRNSTAESGSTQWGNNRAVALQLKGSSRAENCLVAHHYSTYANSIVNVDGSSVLRNCTIVDATLSATNQYCTVRSPLVIGASATVQNVVVAGVTNTVDNIPCLPTGTRANFLSGAVEGDITGTTFPEGTITGTAESFFKDYANGDYTPAPGGPLYNAGANYEGMASVDLAGNPRKVGSKVDIGCYEASSAAFIIIVR